MSSEKEELNEDKAKHSLTKYVKERMDSIYIRYKGKREGKKRLKKLTLLEYINNNRNEILKQNNLREYFYLCATKNRTLNFNKMAISYLSVNFALNPKYINLTQRDQEIYLNLKNKIKRFFSLFYQELELED